jgi:DNA/RNA endonuclease G (NUC1)
MRDTFNLASTTPMHTNTNTNGVWTSIEDTIREYSKKSKGPEDIYVYTGSSGGTDTKAPTHVWKLVYDSSAKKAWAYWLPNTASSAMYNPEAAALTLEQLRENIKAIDGVNILFNVKLPSAPVSNPEEEEI